MIMTKYEDLENRIILLEKEVNCKNLEKKVDENTDSVAFSIFPSSISDVITVADKKLTMPPKSTWFDPKPLDGLVVYEFEKIYE